MRTSRDVQVRAAEWSNCTIAVRATQASVSVEAGIDIWMRVAWEDGGSFSAQDHGALCCDTHFRWPWSDADCKVEQGNRAAGADTWRRKEGRVPGDEGRWKAPRFPQLMTWVMSEKGKVLCWCIWGEGWKYCRGGRAGCSCRPNLPSYTSQTLEVRKNA